MRGRGSTLSRLMPSRLRRSVLAGLCYAIMAKAAMAALVAIVTIVAIVAIPAHAAGPDQEPETEPDTHPDADADPETDPEDADEERTEGEITRAKLMEISCRDDEEHPAGWLDQTYSYLNQRLCEPAAWFDGFFGDDRALEETPVGTFFRIRNEVRWDESEGLKARIRLSANISLPGASDRLRLLFTRDEDVRGEFEPYLPAEDSGRQTRVGFRYNLSDTMRSRLDLDGTVQLKWGLPNPLVRGRYRQVQQLTDDSFARYTQIAFWEAEDGLGTTSRVDLEWFRDYDTQVRWTGQGTWSESSAGVDWRSGVAFFRQLDEKTAIRTELGAFGWTDPEFKTEETYLNFRFRRSFLRSWLYYELQPERAWVIDEGSGNRRGDWRFIVTLEAQFENPPARAEREERQLRRLRDWINRQVKDESGAVRATDG